MVSDAVIAWTGSWMASPIGACFGHVDGGTRRRAHRYGAGAR
jgi:hypothetical protein